MPPSVCKKNMDVNSSKAKKPKYSQLNGDDSFQQRSSAVFSSLDRLEPARESEPRRSDRRLPRRVPDHVVHPEKWTKYSLEEDGTSGLRGVSGDVSNRNIALSFLEDLRKRREAELKREPAMSQRRLSTEDESGEQGKIVFSAKSKVEETKAPEVSGEHQSRVKDGVNVMPEYEIGNTPKKRAKPTCAQRTRADDGSAAEQTETLTLEHLQDEPEELEERVVHAEQQRGDVGEGKAVFAKRKGRGNRGMRKRGVEAAALDSEST